MKRIIQIIAAALSIACAGVAVAQSGEKQTIKLVSGDTLTGTVGAVRDGSVSIITDYGPMRIPIDKITVESRKEIGITDAPNLDEYRKRITELESLVTRLREENATLRRGQAGSAIPEKPVAVQPFTGGRGSGVGTYSPGPAPAASSQGGAFRISSTGKRHNSRCRYYSSNGRACSASEGVACKVCGG